MNSHFFLLWEHIVCYPGWWPSGAHWSSCLGCFWHLGSGVSRLCFCSCLFVHFLLLFTVLCLCILTVCATRFQFWFERCLIGPQDLPTILSVVLAAYHNVIASGSGCPYAGTSCPSGLSCNRIRTVSSGWSGCKGLKLRVQILNIHQIHRLWLPQKCCPCKQKLAVWKLVSSSCERVIPKPITCAINDKHKPLLCEQLNRTFQNEICDSAFWDDVKS